MKWFKFDSDFYTDNRVLECIETLGLKGYHLYITLLCIISQQWNGEKDKTFIILESNLVRICAIYRLNLSQMLAKLAPLFGLIVSKHGPNYHIQYPKFLKKQASYFRGVISTCNSNRIDKNRREEDCSVDKINAERQTIYDTPKKKVQKIPTMSSTIFNYFKESFKQKKQCEYFVSNYGKDFKLIRCLIKKFSEEEIKTLIDKFFNSKDKFIENTDYGIGVFYTQINKLQSETKKIKYMEDYFE